MNKTTEALKMAIEALQNNQTYDWKGNPLTALDEANEKVINACKEALAEAESESSSQLVAWYGIGDMHVWKLNLEEDKDATLKVVNRPLANNENWKPLYTHPATWQSLSDDEITEILVKHGLDNVEMAGNHIDVVLLMRDVERAHGIGEQHE